MKPQRFEIGQAVTPKIDKEFALIKGSGDSPDPKFGNIYHVSEYLFEMNEWFISLDEMPDDIYYSEIDFDPVITTSELTEALEEIETMNV